MKIKILKYSGFVIFFTIFNAFGKPIETEHKLISPDGKIVVNLMMADGKPTQSVQKSDKIIIGPSNLGFVFERNDSLNSNLEIKKLETTSKDETWQQPWGEEIDVRNHFNELKICLQEKAGKKRRFNLIFRAFNDGIGFRYEFLSQTDLKEFQINDELTDFAFAENDSAWSIPSYKVVYYESLWKKDKLSKKDTITTPLTIETSDGKYVLLHEANLIDYAKMNVFPVKGSSTLKVDLTPWSTGVKVYARTPMVTSWRTIVLADNLN